MLAVHNLLHKKIKTAIAVAGVTFAVVLMFMQLGFLEAVKASATVTYDFLDFDICLRSRDYLHLAEPRDFPRTRLARVESDPSVTSAAPLLVTMSVWNHPRDGQNRAILCLGIRPQDAVFANPQMQSAARALLRRSDALLVDTKTRGEYGAANGSRFGDADSGSAVELNGKSTWIAGCFTCGAGLSSAGAVILNEQGILRTAPYAAADSINLGLLKIAAGENPGQVAARLEALLGADAGVEVLTRQDVLNSELNHWVLDTNYGLIFQTGVFMSILVGMAISYQVLASDVASMLPEYATLKAIGYSNRYISGVILQQAVLLAVAGFLVGLLIASVLYELTSAGAQVPVRFTAVNIGSVLGLALVMCVCAGLAALRKAFQSDPADLF